MRHDRVRPGVPDRVGRDGPAVRDDDQGARLAELEARGNTTTMPTEETTFPQGRTPRAQSVFHENSEGLASAEIAGDVLFSPGSDVIKTDAKKTLDKVASEIKSTYARASIRVEGYTDSDPLIKTKAKWGSNEKLSQARAESVRKYLINKGVKSNSVEAMGYGSAKPKATKAQSRRVEILVIQ